MADSILDSIKKLLGIAAEYKNFDTDIIIHINSVFMILKQLGIGPEETFKIYDDTAVWEDYITEEDNLEAVKSYIYLKVKQVFDPALSSAVKEANKEMLNELEWRLNIQAETNSDE